MTEPEIYEEFFEILQKGDEVQKLSVIDSLPQLIKLDEHATVAKILPKILNELQTSTSEFKISVSRMYQMLIQNNFRANDTIVTTILHGIDSSDPVVANAWLETLLTSIPVLPVKVLHNDVIPCAIVKGNLINQVPSRVIACKILGKVAMHPQIKAIDLKTNILTLIYSLCQDVSYAVRASMCEQIPVFAKVLGLVKNYFLPHLVELCSDNNVLVKSTAITSVLQVATFVDRESKISTLVPLIVGLTGSDADIDDPAFVMLAKDFTLLLSSLDTCLTREQAKQILIFYEKLAKRGLDVRALTVYNIDSSQDVKCREYCAITYPAVLSFTIKALPESTVPLYDTFKALSNDPFYLVRHTAASKFQDVARILGAKNQIMKAEFVRLLRDDAEEVLNTLVPYISGILNSFHSSGLLSYERMDSASTDIGKALLKCLVQLNNGFKWRITASFLKQLESLPMVFKSDHIHNDFTPLVVHCAIKGRPRPIRSQAVRTLLFFLRYNTKQIQRTWLRDHLVHELAENRSCYTRHIFIILCEYAMDIFSNKYFKENFYMALLKLANDKVSTIRYAVVSLLVRLRRMINMPQDRKYMQAFDQTFILIERNEKDRDVVQNILIQSREIAKQSGQQANDQRERKLLEEEDNINKGKLDFMAISSDSTTVARITGRAPAHPGPIVQSTGGLSSARRSQSISRRYSNTPVGGSVGSIRSASAPRSSSKQIDIISDMTFLKQHFYTDAGINLPDPPNTSELATTPPDTITTLIGNCANLSLENATDDIKVNLRRKTLNTFSEIPTTTTVKNKRHSTSVFLTDRVTLKNKRRSLNIPTMQRESKIPVILKPSERVDSRKKNEEKQARRNSGLPVPVRRK